MGIVGDIKAILEWVEKLGERDKHNAEQKNFNAVMRSMYELSDHGSHSIDLADLQQLGLGKIQVFSAVESANARGWLIDCASHDSRYSWIPNQRACQYVEALLEEETA